MSEGDPPGAGMRVLHLDLAAAEIDARVVAAAVRAVDLDELRIVTLRDAGRGEESVGRLYRLVREGVIDDPGTTGRFMDAASFARTLFEPYYWRWADSQFIAATGDAWIGLVNLQLREPTRAEFGVTVVRRAYRRRGVGRALKLRALLHAREIGVARLTTRNHPGNAAILRLNESLGFEWGR